MSESQRSLEVAVFRTDMRAKVPEYATSGSSGCDLCALEAGIVYPNTWKLVMTGLIIGIPGGYEAQVRSRSGMCLKKGVFVMNGPGTIDNDYRGEIGVILFNAGQDPFVYKSGDRIAQLVIARVEHIEFLAADALSETLRGGGGFGSTGMG